MHLEGEPRALQVCHGLELAERVRARQQREREDARREEGADPRRVEGVGVIEAREERGRIERWLSFHVDG